MFETYSSHQEKNFDIEPWFSLTLSLSSSRVDLPRENRRDEGKLWRESKKIMSWENLCTGSTFSEKKPLHPSHSLCLLKKLYSKEPFFFDTLYILNKVLNELSSKPVQQDMATGSSCGFVAGSQGKVPRNTLRSRTYFAYLHHVDPLELMPHMSSFSRMELTM